MSQEGAQPEIGLPPGQVAVLEVVRGPDLGLRVELAGPRTVIGRRQGEIVLTDREVSSVHAAIEASGGAFVVKDLGSTNGTFVDGQKVSSGPIQPGSHVKVGATYLRFDVLEEAPLLEAEPLVDEEPLIAAASGPSDDPAHDMGLGGGPLGLSEDTPPPSEAALVPPGGQRPASGVAAPAALEALEAPLEDSGPLLEEIPTGIAPPSSVPGSIIPPAAGMAIPPAGLAARAPAPAAPAEAPPPAAAIPPRVGVTSHGGQRAAQGGTPWDSLSIPGSSVPIPPSPGGSPHVATPLPGAIRVPVPEAETPHAPLPAASPLPAGVAVSPHDLYLVVEAGTDVGKVFPITAGLTVLGRSDLGIQIHDADVSRRHVALELQGTGPHLLRDLGSTNGTLLNGVKVTENLISPNDIVRMGVTRLKLVKGARALAAEIARVSGR